MAGGWARSSASGSRGQVDGGSGSIVVGKCSWTGSPPVASAVASGATSATAAAAPGSWLVSTAASSELPAAARSTAAW
jgi:hypothetical protein